MQRTKARVNLGAGYGVTAPLFPGPHRCRNGGAGTTTAVRSATPGCAAPGMRGHGAPTRVVPAVRRRPVGKAHVPCHVRAPADRDAVRDEPHRAPVLANPQGAIEPARVGVLVFRGGADVVVCTHDDNPGLGTAGRADARVPKETKRGAEEKVLLQ